MASLTNRRLQSLFDAGQFDECVRQFEKLENLRPLRPNELVQKGRCMPLSSGVSGSLVDVERVFQAALDLEADYVPALLELGWFLYAVKDDAAGALAFFERAAILAGEDAREAEDGRQKCLQELDQDAMAELRDDQ